RRRAQPHGDGDQSRYLYHAAVPAGRSPDHRHPARAGVVHRLPRCVDRADTIRREREAGHDVRHHLHLGPDRHAGRRRDLDQARVLMSFIGHGGSFKRWLSGSSGTGCAIGVGGTWKSITGMWIGEGGTWQRFFPVEKVTLSGTSGSPNVIAKPAGGLVTITWEFTTSGGVLGDGAPFNSGTEWIDVAPQLEYWIRAQTNS